MVSVVFSYFIFIYDTCQFLMYFSPIKNSVQPIDLGLDKSHVY